MALLSVLVSLGSFFVDGVPAYYSPSSDIPRYESQGSNPIFHRTPPAFPEPLLRLSQRSPPESPDAGQPIGSFLSAPTAPVNTKPPLSHGSSKRLSLPIGLNPRGNFLQERGMPPSFCPKTKLSRQEEWDSHSLTQLGIRLKSDERNSLVQVRKAIRNLVHEFQFDTEQNPADKPVIIKEGAIIFTNLFSLPWFLKIEENQYNNGEGSSRFGPDPEQARADDQRRYVTRKLRRFEGMRLSSPIQKALMAWLVGCLGLAKYFVHHADEIVKADPLFKIVAWKKDQRTREPDVDAPPLGEETACVANSVGMMMVSKALDDANREAFPDLSHWPLEAWNSDALHKTSHTNTNEEHPPESLDPLCRSIRHYYLERMEIVKGEQ